MIFWIFPNLLGINLGWFKHVRTMFWDVFGLNLAGNLQKHEKLKKLSNWKIKRNYFKSNSSWFLHRYPPAPLISPYSLLPSGECFAPHLCFLLKQCLRYTYKNLTNSFDIHMSFLCVVIFILGTFLMKIFILDPV